MEIKRPAMAGTLESSDCQVTVEPGDGQVEFELESAVMHQFGKQIRKVVMETLAHLDVKDVRITVVDKGALDCTSHPYPWGGEAACDSFLHRAGYD